MSEALVEMVRGLIGFFTLLIFARLLGKQQISQLTFFDYVLGITVGSIAASLTTDLTSRAWPHWVGLVTWIACVLSPTGRPTCLNSSGKKGFSTLIRWPTRCSSPTVSCRC